MLMGKKFSKSTPQPKKKTKLPEPNPAKPAPFAQKQSHFLADKYQKLGSKLSSTPGKKMGMDDEDGDE